MKHTPGPWEIDSSDGQWWIYGGKDKRPTIGVAKCDLIVNAVLGICKQQNVFDQQMPEEERQANARLISAAPDLLAVAKRAVAGCACHATMRPDTPCLSCAAREAVRKAEGGTP